MPDEQSKPPEMGVREIPSPSWSITLMDCAYVINDIPGGPPDPESGLPSIKKLLQFFPADGRLVVNVPLSPDAASHIAMRLQGKSEGIDVFSMLPADLPDLSKLKDDPQ